MDRLRQCALLIIFFATAGGVWARCLYASSNLAESAVEIRQPPENASIHVAGTFIEQLAALPGLEVSSPNCPLPWAVLPISMRRSAIIPTEYRYRPGDYDVAYVYNGSVYPEAGVSYKLSLLHILYRFQSMFGLIEGRQFAFYLKIWVPRGCPGVSADDASALERGLIVRVEEKNA
jgi:hypothetical protein